MASPDIPPEQRALFEYGGLVSFNFLAIDDAGQETHILRQTDLAGFLRVNLDGAHEFFLRAHTSYLDFNEGDAFRSSGDDLVEPTLDRAHYRFNLQRSMAAYEGRQIPFNVIVQGGRQLVHWANGLTLSEQIDGAVVRVSHNQMTLDMLAGVTRDTTTDFDSSRPNFTNDTQRNFYGAMLAVQALPRHRPYVYGIVQRDNNPSEVATVGGVAHEFEYDSHYIGFGSTGSFRDNLVYGLEMVYEGGRGLSASTGPVSSQTEEPISAMAMDLRIDHLLNDPNRSRIGGEVLLATGDKDRRTTSNTVGGNRSGTDDHAFNGFGLINTGLAFSPDVSNLLMFRAGASTFPLRGRGIFDRMQVGVNLLIFNKLNRTGPIAEATDDNRYLGWESDLFVNWQLRSDLSVTLRYGVFFPGDAIQTDHDERHFFFSGITLAF